VRLPSCRGRGRRDQVRGRRSGPGQPGHGAVIAGVVGRAVPDLGNQRGTSPGRHLRHHHRHVLRRDRAAAHPGAFLHQPGRRGRSAHDLDRGAAAEHLLPVPGGARGADPAARAPALPVERLRQRRPGVAIAAAARAGGRAAGRPRRGRGLRGLPVHLVGPAGQRGRRPVARFHEGRRHLVPMVRAHRGRGRDHRRAADRPVLAGPAGRVGLRHRRVIILPADGARDLVAAAHQDRGRRGHADRRRILPGGHRGGDVRRGVIRVGRGAARSAGAVDGAAGIRRHDRGLAAHPADPPRQRQPGHAPHAPARDPQQAGTEQAGASPGHADGARPGGRWLTRRPR
jgi:hypothetical protein